MILGSKKLQLIINFIFIWWVKINKMNKNAFTALCCLVSYLSRKSTQEPYTLWLVTVRNTKALMTSLFHIRNSEERQQEYFVRWRMIFHLLLECSQGFVTHSQHLFEFTHQWCIKGCSDGRGSIISRSLEDKGKQKKQHENLQNGKPGSSKLRDWKLPYFCSSLPCPQWTR